MSTPQFISHLRQKIGHDELWLPGVTGIVFSPAHDRVLLVRRRDNGSWTPVTGIVEPGENPADAIVREILEETAVTAIPERIIAVTPVGPVTYPNGDVARFMDTCFVLQATSDSWQSARVNDDESATVIWNASSVGALPPMKKRFVDFVALAHRNEPCRWDVQD